MTLYLILAGVGLFGFVLWLLGRRNRKLGELKQANETLSEARKLSKQANEIDRDIDRLPAHVKRQRLRDKLNK